MIFWATSITVSVALLVITAAMKSANPPMAYAHMMIAAVMVTGGETPTTKKKKNS